MSCSASQDLDHYTTAAPKMPNIGYPRLLYCSLDWPVPGMLQPQHQLWRGVSKTGSTGIYTAKIITLGMRKDPYCFQTNQANCFILQCIIKRAFTHECQGNYFVQLLLKECCFVLLVFSIFHTLSQVNYYINLMNLIPKYLWKTIDNFYVLFFEYPLRRGIKNNKVFWKSKLNFGISQIQSEQLYLYGLTISHLPKPLFRTWQILYPRFWWSHNQ